MRPDIERERCLGQGSSALENTDTNVYRRSEPETQACSWRDRIAVHPAADLLPEMSEAELLELGKDIAANGLQQPIILYCDQARRHRRGFLVPDGEVVVLDGRNRLTAMEMVGIELFDESGYLAPQVEYQDGHKGVRFTYGKWPLNRDAWHPDVEPYSHALSANAHRRHLSLEQKRDLVEKLLKANPERSDRSTAKLAGLSHPVVADIRRDLEESGDVERISTRTDAAGRQQPARKPNADPAKSRLRLDLPPRVNASSTANTDHVEREYTNLITVWNNSSREPARARFLRAIGAEPSPSVEPDDNLVTDPDQVELIISAGADRRKAVDRIMDIIREAALRLSDRDLEYLLDEFREFLDALGVAA